MIWKKIVRPLIYSLSAPSLLFFGSLFFSYSAYADTGITNTTMHLTYTTNLDNPLSNWTTADFSGPITSIWPNTGDHRSTGFGLRNIRVRGSVGSKQVLTARITFHIRLYSWNGAQKIFNIFNCSGLDFSVGAFDTTNGSTLREPVSESHAITSCNVANGSDIYGDLVLDLDYTFSFNEITNFDTILLNFWNPPSFTSPNSGYILACHSDNDALGIYYPCAANNEQYFWPNWYFLDFDVSVESTTDPQTAILWEQLGIQREEQSHRRELEQQAGNSLDSGNSDAQSGAEAATTFTTNYLDVLIRFRDMLLNIHTTDCNITFPQTGNMTPQGGRFNLGTINFCALSVPTPIMSIASLAIFWLMIKLSIWVVRQFYETFEEMIDGGGGK